MGTQPGPRLVLRTWLDRSSDQLPIVVPALSGSHVLSAKPTVEKGFGYAVMPASPVTPETLFYCGSTTKSFTAAAVSLLVDDQDRFPHVGWDTPISSLIRDDFVLSDAWATNHVTVEDALSHRTGYAGHTMGINNSDPRECVRRLRHLPMSAEPRTTWQYSNYMFTAVGHAIETLTGQWLGDFFRERLWSPMGMNSTYLRREDAETAGNNSLAAEYWWDWEAQSYVEVPHLPHGRGREGAGMIISNVEDYARYLRHMMAESPPLSEAGHAEIKKARTVMPGGRRASSPYTGPQFYSLGWSGGVIEGREFWSHNGRIREHVSEMWMFPSLGFGLILLINANQPSATSEIAWKIIYDRLGVEPERRRYAAGK